ncbi:VOC family protein [Natrinema caseinilyticum]|uniref:VOC family protein n=1 Tax=Natrinema caseinilyticum TaxID=2961570 RepID=UPI0020C43D16|nr:VOC family protein [Natrinema caseinilyticum]
MVEGVHHAALAVSDLPRAVSFYEGVLEFTPIGPDNPENTIETADYFWMDIGGGEWINFADRPDVTPKHPGDKDDPHLAFRATEDEISSVKQRLVVRDVEVHETRTSIYFHDPDGNFLELTDWNGPDK